MCRQEDGYSFMPGDVPHMHWSEVYIAIERKKETDPTYFRQSCSVKCIGE